MNIDYQHIYSEQVRWQLDEKCDIWILSAQLAMNNFCEGKQHFSVVVSHEHNGQSPWCVDEEDTGMYYAF